ncbi:MAG: hypothetical protein V5A16_04850 [Haloplanus sp.]
MTEQPSTSRRSTLAALAVALLGSGTGCLGGGSVSETATPTATPTANTDCPPALTVEAIDSDAVDAESAVAYDNLSAERRETFDRARNGSVEDFDYAWHDIDFVEHDGQFYSVGIVVC